MPLSGRCLCGRVTYTADADPVFTAVCHCKVCQRQSGAAFATLVALPKEAVLIVGAMKTHTEAGASGKPIHRHFCPECGSSLVVEAGTAPGKVLVTAGSLDDSSFVRPTMQVFCESAQPWVTLTQDIPQFPKMPVPR